MQTLANIFWLGTKELRSFVRDFVLLGLVIYSFSLAIIAQAQSSSQEVHNAAIAIVDEDRSELSRRIAHAFLLPYFQTPQPIAERDIVPLMKPANTRLYSTFHRTFSATCLPSATPRFSSMSMQPLWCRRGSAPVMRSRS